MKDFTMVKVKLDTHKKLKVLAAENGVTLSQMIEQLMAGKGK